MRKWISIGLAWWFLIDLGGAGGRQVVGPFTCLTGRPALTDCDADAKARCENIQAIMRDHSYPTSIDLPCTSDSTLAISPKKGN